MESARVQALANVHGLRYGEQRDLLVTPAVEKLIERGLLALVDTGGVAPQGERQVEAGDQAGASPDAAAGADEGPDDADADPASTPGDDEADGGGEAAETPRRSRRRSVAADED